MQFNFTELLEIIYGKQTLSANCALCQKTGIFLKVPARKYLKVQRRK